MLTNGYIRNAHICLPLPKVPGISYRYIVKFPGYAIGDNCHIISHKSGKWKDIAVQVLGGYLSVMLWRNGKSSTQRVHRLLMEAFIGPCPEGMQSRHLDGNSLNNSLNNLVWGTAAENALDRQRHGTQVKGDDTRAAKLSEEQVVELMERLAVGEGKADLAKAYKVCVNDIYAINIGQLWKHLPSPTGKYPIAPDRRKPPFRKQGVRPRGYKLRMSEEAKRARAKKIWETRRKNQVAQQEVSNLSVAPAVAPDGATEVDTTVQTETELESKRRREHQ